MKTSSVSEQLKYFINQLDGVSSKVPEVLMEKDDGPGVSPVQTGDPSLEGTGFSRSHKYPDMLIVRPTNHKMVHQILSSLMFTSGPPALRVWTFKQAKERILCFSEMAGKSGDVEDPYGQNQTSYFRILKEIEIYAEKIISSFDKLK